MVTVTEIAVDLVARADRLIRTIRTAESAVDRGLGGMERRGQAFASRFNSALAGVSAVVLAREFLQLTDTAAKIDAQLRLATQSFGSFGKAQEESRRIANDTRSSLEATSKLYGNFARAAQAVGGTQIEAGRATETFSKALKLGGASAAEATSATLQFGQALASGRLNGDELRAVLEASPRLARLLSESLGVTVGELQELGEEGKLTGDKLFRALTDRKFTAAIDDEFATLPVTFGDAMTKVQNAALITFSAFDRGGQFSNALVNFLGTGSESFTALERAAAESGIEMRAAFEGLGDVFQPLLSGAESAFAGVRQEANYTRDTIATILSGLDFLQNARTTVANIQSRAENVTSLGFGQQSPIRPVNSDFAGQFRKRFDQERQRGRSKLYESNLNDRAGGRIVNGKFVLNASAALQRGTPQPIARDDGKKKRTKAAPKSPLNEDVFTRQEAQLNDRLLRAKGDQVTSAEETARIELDRITNEQSKRDELNAGDKRLTGEQKKQLAALSNLVASTEAAAVIRQRDIATEERTSAAIRRGYDSVNAQNREDQALVQSRVPLARTAKDRLALELRLLKLAQDQERADQEQLIADRRRVLTDPNSLPDARATAAADIRDAERVLVTLPERQANEAKVVQERNQGPLADYLASIPRNADEAREAIERLKADGVRSLEDGLVGVLSGTESLGDAFGRMVDQMIADLARLALRQLIIAPLLNALGGGGFGGGFSSILGAVGVGDSGGVAASGGVNGGIGGGLPKLAGGGTIKAGGLGGVDRNVLSVNGTPRAMIGSHEVLSVANPAAQALAGNVAAMTSNMRAVTPVNRTTVVHAPQFILKGSYVDRDLFKEMERISNASVANAAPHIAQAGADQAYKDMSRRGLGTRAQRLR